MNINENIIVIGVEGCSRNGKTLLVNELINQYKQLTKVNDFSDVYEVMHLDDYANYQKVMFSKVKTSLGNIYGNWEFPGSLDWDIFYQNIKIKLKNMNSKLQNAPQNKNKKGILILEGFLIFSPLLRKKNIEIEYLNIFDVLIFIALDKATAKMRRMKTTSVPDDYYEEILWPEYIKNCSKYIDYFNQQKNNNKNVLIIDGNIEYDIKNLAVCILKWMNIIKDDKLINKEIYNDIFISYEQQIYLIEDSLSPK